MRSQAKPISVSALTALPPDTPVLLAYSGGADSTALLHLLLDAQKREGFVLVLAHVNHGIRGEEAVRDRDFCVAEAKRLGLEICVLDADVPTVAKKEGKSLELAAREVRYAYFQKLMQERKIPILATAHHADDQLETVLFRLLRGTGSRGLSGILPVREFAGGLLIRPLLQYSKAELSEYCHENALTYVTDRTNEDTAYTRNRIRHELVPVMESLSPSLRSHIAQLCESAREDEEYLSGLAKDFLEIREEDGSLPVDRLQALPTSICKRVLLLWAGEGCKQMPEAVHVNALMRLVQGPNSNGEVALAGGMFARIRGGTLKLFPSREARKASFVLPVQTGETVLEGTEIRITVEKLEKDIKIHNLSTAPYIILKGEFDIIKKDLHWRSKREGETQYIRGMHRKLRRLYAEAGVAPEYRDTIPLLCSKEGVVWAPLIGQTDGWEPSFGGDTPTWLVQVRLPKDIMHERTTVCIK